MSRGNLNRDSVHLGRLRDYYARHGALPSYAGLGELVGFRAKTAAVKLAGRLEAAGYIRPAPGGKLAPTPRFFGLPLMSTSVRAGTPEAVPGEEAPECLTLDGFLIDKPSSTVLIRVKGDSMKDAGILEGDLAAVERTPDASAGDLVVALVDGEFTLKELAFEGQDPVLLPHNSAFMPVRAVSGLEIFGVVRGIVRRYSPLAPARRRASMGETK